VVETQNVDDVEAQNKTIDLYSGFKLYKFKAF
jgi:hypothetical protein